MLMIIADCYPEFYQTFGRVRNFSSIYYDAARIVRVNTLADIKRKYNLLKALEVLLALTNKSSLDDALLYRYAFGLAKKTDVKSETEMKFSQQQPLKYEKKTDEDIERHKELAKYLVIYLKLHCAVENIDVIETRASAHILADIICNMKEHIESDTDEFKALVDVGKLDCWDDQNARIPKDLEPEWLTSAYSELTDPACKFAKLTQLTEYILTSIEPNDSR